MSRFNLLQAPGEHRHPDNPLTTERNDMKRTKILIPDSAHGTNPASALGGFTVVEVLLR